MYNHFTSDRSNTKFSSSLQGERELAFFIRMYMRKAISSVIITIFAIITMAEASKRDNSKNNINNVVEHLGLSKFEKNPVIKPSDLPRQSKEAPRPLVPDQDVH
jgi:hypothetical protein